MKNREFERRPDLGLLVARGRSKLTFKLANNSEARM